MRLRLVISERRPELLALWTDTFRHIESVTVRDVDVRTLMGLPEVDAVLLTSMLAHERYGGRPTAGRSQVLSTKGEPGMPPWVVTTPPFAAHFERTQRPDGTVEIVVARDQDLTPEQEVYILFAEVFEGIERFNKRMAKPSITTLGLDTTSLSLLQGSPRAEAKSVRRAYLEHFELNTAQDA